MRLNRLGKLFNLQRLKRLQQDFRTPYKALLAASGVFGDRSKLVTASGDLMYTDRSDLPVWAEYFSQQHCRITIDKGKFHIHPHNKLHKDYYIQGCTGAMTYQPQRFCSESLPPLFQQLQAAEAGLYSQHGEEGVIRKLLELIGIKHKFIVEFGAHDAINMSNSRYLITEQGWRAFLIEANPSYFNKLQAVYKDNPAVTVHNSFVTKENINTLFRQAGVPTDFDVLSIDVDGPDFYLWQALTDFTPSIVIIEYNSSKPPGEDYVVPEDKVFELGATKDEGASLLALYKLGKQKGYEAVYSELYGANLFFVHQRLADKLDLTGINPDSLYQPPQFGELAGTEAPSGRGYR